ncbi:hypothetical protein [Occallatibacter savannae]|uniref:hypothetical protein n=1 Tax=Occallatibacter savannae TaxID=1002691 RepID=UPI000D69029C|nr:hypothetical protein [Occallatibacter savannae]
MQMRGRGWRVCVLILLVWGFVAAVPDGRAEAPQKAVNAFETYVANVEARLGQQHRSTAGFLAEVKSDANRPGNPGEQLRRGQVVIEKLTPDKGEVPGGMLHDWRGTAFVEGATAADFEQLMKNFSSYPQMYSPEVVRARIVSPQTRPVPDQFTAEMRVKQKHVITVVMDTTYDVTFGRLDTRHGYSTSRSTRISEIEDAGTQKERVLAPDKEHGFLWRLNTYWSYEERDGGLYMQIESVSLTRGIPAGLVWAIGPFVESVPRESLEFTLRNTCRELTKRRGQ